MTDNVSFISESDRQIDEDATSVFMGSNVLEDKPSDVLFALAAALEFVGVPVYKTLDLMTSDIKDEYKNKVAFFKITVERVTS